jgi:CSLREA domain-containing protein
MKTISSTAMPAGRIAAFGLGLALMVALLVLLAPRPAYAATFTVNQTGDAKDRNINNSVCDVSRKNGNQCTLRAAIQEANNTPGADTIDFNIGGTASVKTIKPARPLPVIKEAVTINGYSQGSATTATSDDAKENTLDEGNDAVLKVQLNGTDAGPAHGLVIQASDSTIKGLVINRFAGNGVLISGSSASSATDNKVLGNFVGTNASGTEPLGNGGEGVEIFDASDNTVGGAREAARNVISGNTDDGVEFQGDTLGNEVLGNFIGTKANGIEALGNGNDGVHILGEGNTVGGTVSNTRNVISGNGGDGVDLQGINTKDNKIEGNFIGTKASSTQDLGNGEDGVNIRDGAFDNTIGGTASGAGNRIAHNGQDGVTIASSTGNGVLSNFIFSNTGLGIDLGASGVTNNDPDDPDTGANNLQNYPEDLSATRLSTGSTIISGTLNSNPSQSFTVQCFVAAPDGSGHGEGQIPAGQDTTVTTDANGDGSFACVSSVPQAGQLVTATATNTSGTATGTAIGDTSEFSQIVGVVAGS